MPIISLDRLPLPTLQTYTCFSVLTLLTCIYFTTEVIEISDWENKDNVSKKDDGMVQNTTYNDKSFGKWIALILTIMIREPACVWVLINMAICWLILIGQFIQKLVFGELRGSEQKLLKDKFLNFVFYKFIFIFGVINVQNVEEILLWFSWYALLGFLQMLAQLTKDRFEYLSFSSTMPSWNHVKILVLLTCILAVSCFMLIIAGFMGYYNGFSIFAFMSAEATLLIIRTLHIILRYIFHLYEVRNEEASTTNISNSNKLWDKSFTYFIELGFELTALGIDFLHHIHMLFWSNIFLSMASLVMCMQIRYLFQEIKRRLKKHQTYLLVCEHLEKNYPMALEDELSQNSDNCAICWNKMNSARKLPCKHLFHSTCLQSWLELDSSCPTCRLTLNIQTPTQARMDTMELQNNNPQPTRRDVNHIFHFDGSRYVSWLPSLFVEVRPAQVIRSDTHNSQLDSMAHHVQQLFPHISLSTVVDDLRITRSVELTIENILDGRLTSQVYDEPDLTSMSTSSSSFALQSQTLSQTQKTTKWESIETTIDTDNSPRSRFSKCPEERERILEQRKEYLIKTARNRYIDKQAEIDVKIN